MKMGRKDSGACHVIHLLVLLRLGNLVLCCQIGKVIDSAEVPFAFAAGTCSEFSERVDA